MVVWRLWQCRHVVGEQGVDDAQPVGPGKEIGNYPPGVGQFFIVATPHRLLIRWRWRIIKLLSRNPRATNRWMKGWVLGRGSWPARATAR